jgi:hypothetical protein
LLLFYRLGLVEEKNVALHGPLHVIEKGGIACTEMQDASEVLREDVQDVRDDVAYWYLIQ